MYMTVHDEVVAEVPESFGSVEEFQRILTMLPSWADGLPIAAKAREGSRFCKISKSESVTDHAGAGDTTAEPDETKEAHKHADDEADKDQDRGAKNADQACDRRDGDGYASFDFSFVTCVDDSHFKALRRGHGLDDGELTNREGYREITKHCHSRYTWRDLLEQFRPLSA